MFASSPRKVRPLAGGANRHRPRLELLEDRTLLTLFTISAVPDATAVQEAVAVVPYSAGTRNAVRAAVVGDANPMGMGLHHGAFYIGSASDLLEIDTAPDAGQNLGDPVTVVFKYAYTALLQNFYAYPPLNPAYVTWHGFLDAGSATQPLFDGTFSTDTIDGDEIQAADIIPINMNVGDSIDVHVWTNGEAYASEPHSRDRVTFAANFVVEDIPASTPALAPIRTDVVGFPGRGQPLEQQLGESHWTEGSAGRTVRDFAPADVGGNRPGTGVGSATLERVSQTPRHMPAASDGAAELVPDLWIGGQEL